MNLLPHESQLDGAWISTDTGVVADATCLRIERLVQHDLRELARDASGWDVLYIDPMDGRLWELTYPRSEWQGGGPPRLSNLPVTAAAMKYGKVLSGDVRGVADS